MLFYSESVLVFSCWFQFCNQFYPGRPFHLGRDPVRAFHLCTRHNSPSQIRLQDQGLSVNTSSPRRKCLTRPKCNSRTNTLLHMEKTTSPSIFIPSILPPQPAATRKGDIVPSLTCHSSARIFLEE